VGARADEVAPCFNLGSAQQRSSPHFLGAGRPYRNHSAPWGIEFPAQLPEIKTVRKPVARVARFAAPVRAHAMHQRLRLRQTFHSSLVFGFFFKARHVLPRPGEDFGLAPRLPSLDDAHVVVWLCRRSDALPRIDSIAVECAVTPSASDVIRHHNFRPIN